MYILQFRLMIVIAMALLFTTPLFANQIGLNFSQDSIGVLGDYEKSLGAYEFAVDAQAQKTDSLSTVLNASVTRSFGAIGIKPFIAYSKAEIGTVLDAGGLVNVSVGALDIAAGASFRGANPTAAALEKRFDADNTEVEVHAAGYSPNAYQLPAANNINLALNTGFEYRKVETGLTAYVPITERDIVPIVIISRSQTSIDLADNLSLALVVDARTYLYKDTEGNIGAEVSFKPLGAVTFKF